MNTRNSFHSEHTDKSRGFCEMLQMKEYFSICGSFSQDACAALTILVLPCWMGKGCRGCFGIGIISSV